MSYVQTCNTAKRYMEFFCDLLSSHPTPLHPGAQRHSPVTELHSALFLHSQRVAQLRPEKPGGQAETIETWIMTIMHIIFIIVICLTVEEGQAEIMVLVLWAIIQ